MANDFKNIIKNNITTQTTVYTVTDSNPSVLLELDIANTQTISITASVTITDNSTSITSFLIKDAPIPIGSALQAINGQKIVLEQNDTLKVSASGAVDVVGSVLSDVVS